MNANIAAFLRAAADRHPDGTALIVGEDRCSWRDLDRAVDAFAAGCVRRGLRAGERVALLLGNSYEFVVAYLGVARAGLVSVPLNPAYTAPEVAVMLSDSGARLLLVQPATAAVGRAAADPLPGCEVVDVSGAGWDRLVVPDAALVELDTPPDTLALLLFTAGTSGRPKGAMLTHGALRANIVDLLGLTDPPAVTDADVVLVVLPLFHVYGLNTALGLSVAAGATIVLSDRFDPVECLALIARHHVTTVAGVPGMYRAWCAVPGLREAMTTVRLLSSGAAPLPARVYEQFAELTGLRIYEGYGMTETAPVVSTTLVSGAPKAGSVGRPLPGLEIRLMEDGVEGPEEVDDGDPGEVWIRGASVFVGYWPDGAGGPDADGWFHSGDVAYADDDGDLHLVDRRREVILVNGFNVYPREIEQVIDDVPGVAEVAVVGVPDDVTGEAVLALVVPRVGGVVSPDVVLAHCATRLARFKCPSVVRIVDALPHSATGKIAKGRLREVYGDTGYGQ